MLNPLKVAARRLAGAFGYEVRRSDSRARPGYFRQRIFESAGIRSLIDVGANEGQYGSEIREGGFGGRILSFEPLPDAFARLRTRAQGDPNWMCVQTAVGDAKETVRFNVSGNSQSSSILPIKDAHTRSAPETAYVSVMDTPIDTLDALAGDFVREGEPLCLKIDVQGYEMRVLRGGSRVVRAAELLELELSLVPLYEGQELYREMMDYLDGLGFELHWIERGFSDLNTGRVLQVETIFRRRQMQR